MIILILRPLVFLLTVILFSNCNTLSRYRWRNADGVVIVNMDHDKRLAEETRVFFVEARSAVQDFFSIDTKPPVEIVFAGSRDEFDRLVKNWLGFPFHKVPSRNSLVAVTGKDRMVILSPSAWATETNLSYTSETFRQLIHHETVHLFHSHLNPHSGDAPNYWIEGLPWYIAGQHELESSRKPVLDAIKMDAVPALKIINGSTPLTYLWGWTVAQFVIDEYGKAAALSLLMKATSKNFFEMIAETADSFETKWRAYLKKEILKSAKQESP